MGCNVFCTKTNPCGKYTDVYRGIKVAPGYLAHAGPDRNRKRKETGVVSSDTNSIVSDNCEDTAWSSKLHSTLLTICVNNVTKKPFLIS